MVQAPRYTGQVLPNKGQAPQVAVENWSSAAVLASSVKDNGSIAADNVSSATESGVKCSGKLVQCHGKLAEGHSVRRIKCHGTLFKRHGIQVKCHERLCHLPRYTRQVSTKTGQVPLYIVQAPGKQFVHLFKCSFVRLICRFVRLFICSLVRAPWRVHLSTSAALDLYAVVACPCTVAGPAFIMHFCCA